MLIQQAEAAVSLHPGCRRGCGWKSFIYLFSIKAVPETTALTGPDLVPLRTPAVVCTNSARSPIPTPLLWGGGGSGFSRPTSSNPVHEVRTATKENKFYMPTNCTGPHPKIFKVLLLDVRSTQCSSPWTHGLNVLIFNFPLPRSRSHARRMTNSASKVCG